MSIATQRPRLRALALAVSAASVLAATPVRAQSDAQQQEILRQQLGGDDDDAKTHRAKKEKAKPDEKAKPAPPAPPAEEVAPVEKKTDVEKAQPPEMPATKETPPTPQESRVGSPEPEEPPATTPPPDTSKFIKGDLIHFGTRELVSRYDNFGVRIGPHIINKDIFLGVTPGFALYAGKFSLAMQAPLNLLMLRGGETVFGGGRVRKEDWDEPSDFARVIRFLTYGRKEDYVYFTINTLRPVTIGHGALMNNYQSNIDVDRSMTGVELDMYNDYAGFQLQANDVTFTNRIFGGLAFVKPLSFFTKDDMARSLSLGVEYLTDRKAPTCVEVSASDRRCVPGTQQAANPITGTNPDDTFINLDPKKRRPLVQTSDVQAAGFSGEFKFVKTETSDIKVYSTLHKFTHPDGDTGLTGGLLGRFTVGEKWLNAFRARAEYRNFGEKYLPEYFDTMYEITKYQYPRRSASAHCPANQPSCYTIAPTKFQAVFGDPGNGFPLVEPGRKHGYRAELSWGLFKNDRAHKKIALGIGLEDSTARDTKNFYLHGELPLGILQIFGTYMRLNEDTYSRFIKFKELDGVVLLSGLRLEILPILFINATYSRSYQIIASPGHELHLGNPDTLAASGYTGPRLPTNPIFENVQQLFVELEFGWEFSEKEQTQPEAEKTK